MKNIPIIIGAVLIILAGGVFLLVKKAPAPAVQPEPVMCTMDAKICPDGTGVGRVGPHCEFAECPASKNNTGDLIKVSVPLSGSVVTSPLRVVGEARGSWFFEGSFPVVITDWDGRTIGQGVAIAKKDWMTTEFVPFEATIKFTVDKTAYSNKGTLILKKDNPSGLPEHDSALEVPVLFSPENSVPVALNQKILINGVTITPLEVMSDSRCSAEVTCIWAGTVTLKTKLEREGVTETVMLTLGTPVTFAGKQVALAVVTPAKHEGKTILPPDYRFEFSVRGIGVLQGTMTIGPICPVERIDNPCLPTPEMFAARKIAVYKSDQTTLVTTITPNSQGKFSTPLAVGTYYVNMATPQTGGPGSVSGLPATITIKQGATVSLVVNVDTGIR
jgi:hypothetical protein